ncbi:MAG: 3-deoxy-D-manno-octulosonate cytidylyltransferase [Anaerolineae bacterium UTCFX2]|jgi:3-deoxy-manno-octulosonate cytidylyltransferase (CMP-KDO synthetase)|nr:MAG: 3-deoxy-D-manno-octulosonate cytidylyltransferase [Anaerolineae bacterium UTCFX2]
MKIICIIPSRYKSTRLEGKPLKDICGKPMIQHVYEAASKSTLATQVVVATDDDRIFQAVQGFGGQAAMTSVDHKTGTDRISEVARGIEADIVANIQGDEPLLDPRQIDEAIEPLIEDAQLKACTLCRRITDEADLNNPNVVKTVFNQSGDALYFSRAPIPYPRVRENHRAYEHIGIYVYRKDFLMEYVQMRQTPLEVSESLEQLRILENGIRLKVVETKYPEKALSVDTPEDLEAVRKIMSQRLAKDAGKS